MLQDNNQIARDNASQAINEAALAQEASNQAERDFGIAIEQAESARISTKSARENSQAMQAEKASFATAEASLNQTKEALVLGEKARRESEESRRKAEFARMIAEEARCKAEDARTLSEKSRDQAEATQSRTEFERALAEDARKLAEDARKLAENARKLAENAKELAEEALKKSQDYARQQELLAQQERLIRHIFQAVHSGKALEDIFQLIVDELGRYLAADRCFISRYYPKKYMLSAPSREYRSSEEIQPIIGTGSELWQGLAAMPILCAKRAIRRWNLIARVQELLLRLRSFPVISSLNPVLAHPFIIWIIA